MKGGIERLVARSPEAHREAGTDVRTGHEATAIDLAAAKVEVHELGGATYRLGYDQLLIATGGVPIRPPLPGIDLPFVHGVQTLDDADHLLRHAEEGCRRIVVVGSGYIGLEMAEAFVERGCTATVIERRQQPMETLDPDMGALVAEAMVDAWDRSAPRRHRHRLRAGHRPDVGWSRPRRPGRPRPGRRTEL